MCIDAEVEEKEITVRLKEMHLAIKTICQTVNLSNQLFIKCSSVRNFCFSVVA